MAWLWLALAGLLEVVWAIGLKYTGGFTRLVPSAITVAAMIASVWTGIGAVGVAVLGMILFDEPRSAMRVASILLIVAGIVGLKLVTP
jgi:quaternary ammonium compound-resistance protein SugE